MPGIVHGGGLTAAIARYGGQRWEWLDLSTGINPNMVELPPVPDEIWNRLPDRSLVEEAKAAARDWYGGIDFPLPVPGTQSFIQILPRLVQRDRRVAIIAPTYGEYAHCFGKAGFQVDEIASPDELRPEHGALVIVNPNNPDGRIFTRDELLAIHIQLRTRKAHLHVDEAFGDVCPQHSLVAEARMLDGLTVSRSFGKFFGLAGLRLGFVFARTETLEFLDAQLGPWAVSGPALYFAARLMRGEREPIAEHIRLRKVGLQTALDQSGMMTKGGTSLFSLVEHKNAAKLFEHLARSNILVRKFDYAPDWLRIGLSPDEKGDRKLAHALASFQG